MRRFNCGSGFVRSAGLALVCGVFAGASASCASTNDKPIDTEEAKTSRVASSIRVTSSLQLEKMTRYVEARTDPRIVRKTMKVNDQDTVDCVDVYLQHGLDHPIYRLEEPPAETGKYASKPVARRDEASDMEYGLTTDLCPVGTIPRRRVQLEELMRFESLEDFFKKSPSRPENERSELAEPLPTLGPTDNHQYVAFRQDTDNHGSEAVLNLWSPYTELSNEFSLSQLWVQRGSGSDLQTVEAGWQVFRDKYGDARAHLFIYFTPDAYGPRGCYNLDCNGFVQTDSSVAIGTAWTTYSTRGGAQYEISLALQQSEAGDWWLKYEDKWLGYWPNSLFDAAGIANGANALAFGGEIIDNRNLSLHTATAMGSGEFPTGGFGHAAYQRNMSYYYGSTASPNIAAITPYALISGPSCYDGTTAFDATSWGRYAYFGGPGYDSTDCR